MPIYNIQAPSGKIYDIEAPEGATSEQLFKYVRNVLEPPTTQRRINPFFDTSVSPTSQSKRAPFTTGIKRGFAQTGVLLGDVLPAMGASLIGADAYAKRQMEEAEATQERIAATLAPQIRSYKEIEGLGDVGTYVLETFGEQIPNILGLITGVGGVTTAAKIAAQKAAKKLVLKRIKDKTTGKERLVGLAGGRDAAEAYATKATERLVKEAGKKAVNKTLYPATFLGSYALNSPEIFQNIYERTGEFAPATALMFGSVAAALDSILPFAIATKLRGNPILRQEVVKKILEKTGANPSVLKSLGVGVGVGALKIGAVEKVTEAAQEGISLTAERLIEDNWEALTSEEFERVIDAGLRGFVVGAGFGAAGGVGTGLRQRNVQKIGEDVAADNERLGELGEELSTETDPTKIEQLNEERDFIIKYRGRVARDKRPSLAVEKGLVKQDVDRKVEAETFVGTTVGDIFDFVGITHKDGVVRDLESLNITKDSKLDDEYKGRGYKDATVKDVIRQVLGSELNKAKGETTLLTKPKKLIDALLSYNRIFIGGIDPETQEGVTPEGVTPEGVTEEAQKALTGRSLIFFNTIKERTDKGENAREVIEKIREGLGENDPVGITSLDTAETAWTQLYPTEPKIPYYEDEANVESFVDRIIDAQDPNRLAEGETGTDREFVANLNKEDAQLLENFADEISNLLAQKRREAVAGARRQSTDPLVRADAEVEQARKAQGEAAEERARAVDRGEPPNFADPNNAWRKEALAQIEHLKKQINYWNVSESVGRTTPEAAERERSPLVKTLERQEADLKEQSGAVPPPAFVPSAESPTRNPNAPLLYGLNRAQLDELTTLVKEDETGNTYKAIETFFRDTVGLEEKTGKLIALKLLAGDIHLAKRLKKLQSQKNLLEKPLAGMYGNLFGDTKGEGRSFVSDSLFKKEQKEREEAFMEVVWNRLSNEDKASDTALQQRKDFYAQIEKLKEERESFRFLEKSGSFGKKRWGLDYWNTLDKKDKGLVIAEAQRLENIEEAADAERTTTDVIETVDETHTNLLRLINPLVEERTRLELELEEIQDKKTETKQATERDVGEAVVTETISVNERLGELEEELNTATDQKKIKQLEEERDSLIKYRDEDLTQAIDTNALNDDSALTDVNVNIRETEIQKEIDLIGSKLIKLQKIAKKSKINKYDKRKKGETVAAWNTRLRGELSEIQEKNLKNAIQVDVSEDSLKLLATEKQIKEALERHLRLRGELLLGKEKAKKELDSINLKLKELGFLSVKEGITLETGGVTGVSRAEDAKKREIDEYIAGTYAKETYLLANRALNKYATAANELFIQQTLHNTSSKDEKTLEALNKAKDDWEKTREVAKEELIIAFRGELGINTDYIQIKTEIAELENEKTINVIKRKTKQQSAAERERDRQGKLEAEIKIRRVAIDEITKELTVTSPSFIRATQRFVELGKLHKQQFGVRRGKEHGGTVGNNDARSVFASLPLDPPITPTTVEKTKSLLNEYMGLDVSDTVSITTTPQEAGLTDIEPTSAGVIINGKPYLFTDNIQEGNELGIFMHEVGVHTGMRHFVGSGNYNWIIKRIRQFADLKDNSPEAQLAEAAFNRVREAKKFTPNISKEVSNHELIAYFVEEAVYRGINPSQESKQTTRLGLFFKKIFNGALRLLRKFGLRVKTLDAQGIVDIAYGAAQLAVRTPADRITPLSMMEMYSLPSKAGEAANAVAGGVDRAVRALPEWTVDLASKIPKWVSTWSFRKTFYNALGIVQLADTVRYSHPELANLVDDVDAIVGRRRQDMDDIRRDFTQPLIQAKKLRDIVRIRMGDSKEYVDLLNNFYAMTNESSVKEVDLRETNKQVLLNETQAALDEVVGKLNAAKDKGQDVTGKFEETIAELQTKIEDIHKLHDAFYSPSMPQEFRDIYTTLADTYEKAGNRLIRFNEDVLGRTLEDSDKIKLGFTTRGGGIVPYFPLIRNGPYWVDAKIDGVRTTYTYKNVFDARRGMANIKKAGDTVLGDKYYARPKQSQQDLTDTRALEDAIKIVAQLGGLEGSTQKQDALDQLNLLLLRHSPNNSLKQQFKKREGTPGYEQDIIANFGQMGLKYSHELAALNNVRELNAALNAVENYKSDEIDPVTELPYRHSFAETAAIDSLLGRRKFLLNPVPNQWAAKASWFGYFMFLAGNISSAIVNLTQLPLVTYGLLAGEYGGANAAREIAAAMKLYMSGGKDDNTTLRIGDWKGMKGWELSDVTLFTKNRTKDENINDLIETAFSRGAVRRTTSQELQEAQFTDDPLTGEWHKVEYGLSWLFQNSERANREISLMATYKLAMKSGKYTHAQAVDTAIRTVDRANGPALAEAGPAWFTDSWGKVIGTFKRFAFSQVFLQLKLLRDMIAPMKNNPNLPAGAPTARAMVIRQFAAISIMTYLFAGLRGVPIYGAVELIANATRDMLKDEGEDYEDMDQYMRQLIGDMSYRGPLSHFLNADFAGRVGFYSLLYRDNPYKRAQLGPFWYAADAIAGPAVAAGPANWVRASRHMHEGRTFEGVELMLPSALRNLMRGFRFSQEGVVNARGVSIVEDTSVYNEVMQGLGFTSNELSNIYQENEFKSRIERKVKEKRSLLLNLWYGAIQDGDYEREMELLDEMDKFNDSDLVRNMGRQITSTSRARSIKSRRYHERRAVHGLSMPRRVQREISDTLGYDPYQ